MAGESPQNYNLFLQYAITDDSIGAFAVSLEEQTGKPTNLPSLRLCSETYQWNFRRNKYRLELANKEELEVDHIRREVKQKLGNISLKVLGKMEEMLDFPTSEIQVFDNIPVTAEMVGQSIPTKTIIKPGDWTVGTVGRLLSGVSAAQKSLQDPATMIRELTKLGYKITLEGRDVITAEEAVEIMSYMEDGSNEELATQPSKRRALKGGD
jgi:hypothetical protein